MSSPVGRDEPFDLGVQRRHQVRLLEERVRGPVRCGQVDDPPRVGGQPVDDGRRGLRRAVQTRKTAPTPRSAASSDPGTARSPVAISTPAGSVAADPGRRTRARTGTPASVSRSTGVADAPGRPG